MSPYDYNRTALPAVTDESSTTTIQIRNINVELTCPICLGILHNTVTVMECLHRFCESCISKSLRLGKKECPTCRVKCTSRRHLRPDPTFDGIISQIYPNLEEYEAKEETLIQQINQKIMRSGSFQESMENVKKRQSSVRGSNWKVRVSTVSNLIVKK
jgi:E3 ubiquitin-protein ligase RNF1/2